VNDNLSIKGMRTILIWKGGGEREGKEGKSEFLDGEVKEVRMTLRKCRVERRSFLRAQAQGEREGEKKN